MVSGPASTWMEPSEGVPFRAGAERRRRLRCGQRDPGGHHTDNRSHGHQPFDNESPMPLRLLIEASSAVLRTCLSAGTARGWERGQRPLELRFKLARIDPPGLGWRRSSSAAPTANDRPRREIQNPSDLLRRVTRAEAQNDNDTTLRAEGRDVLEQAPVTSRRGTQVGRRHLRHAVEAHQAMFTAKQVERSVTTIRRSHGANGRARSNREAQRTPARTHPGDVVGHVTSPGDSQLRPLCPGQWCSLSSTGSVMRVGSGL